MKHYLLLLLLAITVAARAQNTHAYADQVATLKLYDLEYKQPAHPIIFVGSSSIRKWEHLQMAFGGYNVMNRGIGGAVIADISFYVDELITVYQPRQIVLYIGENDLPDSTLSAEAIFGGVRNLLSQIREKLPEVPIVYISMKPSPSRIKFIKKAFSANLLICNYLSTQKRMIFVDVFNLMLDKNKQPRTELFIADQLHMNLAGYSIWEHAIKQYLILK